MALVSFSNVIKGPPGGRVLDHVSLKLQRGDRAALVGGTEEQRTTTLRMLAGLEEPDGGQVHIARGTRVAYYPEVVQVDAPITLHEAMLEVLGEAVAAEAQLQAIGRRDVEMPAMSEFGRLQRIIERAGFDFRHRIDRVLTGLGIPRSKWTNPVRDLEAPLIERLQLARVLIQRADALILNEPTTHLDIDAIEWLEEFICQSPACCVLASCDRRLLEHTADRTFVLMDSKLAIHGTPYSRYSRNGGRAERPSGRGRRGRGAGNGREPRQSEFDGDSRPQPLLECYCLEAGYPDGPTVAFPARLAVHPGDRVGLIGPDGSGKSAILRTLAGEMPALGGSLTRTSSVGVAYLGSSSDFIVLNEKDNRVSRSDVLVVDDPPCEARQALRQFRGALIVATNDRALLDDVTTQMWVIEGNRLIAYARNYTSYKKGTARPLDPPSWSTERAREFVRTSSHLQELLNQAEDLTGRAAELGSTMPVDALWEITDRCTQLQAEIAEEQTRWIHGLRDQVHSYSV